MDKASTVKRPQRCEFSVEFKSSVLDQCCQPGASLAGVALSHGINPNMVHDGIGIWLAARRLHQGKFVWASDYDTHCSLERVQLDTLVLGLP